jgi:hypothetical protein
MGLVSDLRLVTMRAALYLFHLFLSVPSSVLVSGHLVLQM